MKFILIFLIYLGILIISAVIACDYSKGKCKKRCPLNEEYKDCGPACQTECATLNEPCLIRHITCPSGCYCKEGYARQTKGGRCIPIQQCPSKVDQQCPLNEEYKECGPACQTECETLNEPCKIVNIRCPSGCYCKKGYAREPKTGKCIPIIQCPPKQNKCPPNEEYKECGPACQIECETLNEPCKIVNKKCPSGCYCKEGYARQTKGGKCIPIKQCPTKVKYDDEDKSSKEISNSGSNEWCDKNKAKKPKDEDKPKDPKDSKDEDKPKDPKDPKDKEEPKDPKDSKDKDKPKDPKDPKDKDKPKDPNDPKGKDKPKDPKDPKDKDKPKDPKDPKDKEEPKDPKDSKDKDKPKDPKDPKDKDKPKDPNDPKGKDKPKDPKDPKDKEEPKDPKDPKDKDKPKDPNVEETKETEAFNRAPIKSD